MLHLSRALFVLLMSSAPVQAQTCDALKEQVEARIRASGVVNFSVAAVAASAAASGQVVGTCGRGSMKLVYQRGATQPVAPSSASSSASAPAKAKPKPKGTPDEAILTECNDGSMSVGGTCKP
jgi:Protein of unknown function (DUF1161)